MNVEEVLENIKNSDVEGGALWEKWERVYQQIYRLTKAVRKAEERGLAPTELLQGMEHLEQSIKEFKDQIS